MKKRIIHFFVLVIAILWLSLSFRTLYSPLTTLGVLFSYPQGIFFMENPSDELIFTASDYNVDIYFDDFGVPSIKGDKANDVAYGIGFMHARDRYFQMEMITRTVQGRLSEVLGELTLQNDIFWKPLYTDDLAKQEWQNIKTHDPSVYEYLMAYNEGIRKYLSTEKKSERFPEYRFLGEEPRMWKDHYPLLLSYYMSYMLAYSGNDLDWALFQSKLPEMLFKELFSVQTDYPYMFSNTFGKVDEFLSTLDTTHTARANNIDRKMLEKKQSIGSNAWVVSNSKSEGSGALLCNDTHLTVSLPNPWYQAHLICEDFHVQGFTIPCNPYVLSGNNEHIAWGITNTHWDEVDIYKLHVENDEYIVDGEPKEFELNKNIVLVKNGEDYTFESKHTNFGIVRERDDEFYAERWHALEFRSSVLTFEKLNIAKNWDEFRNALRAFTYPPQNFVFADKKGNIGMMSAGKLPYRPSSYTGEMIDGSKSSTVKYVDFEDLPQQYFGDSLYTSTTNQMQAKASYYFNYNWTAPYRALRINEILSAKQRLSVEDMKAAQTDKADRSFDATMELYELLSLTNNRLDYFSELSKWDGHVAHSSRGAVYYYYLYHAIAQNFDALLEEKYDFGWRPSYEKILEYVDPRIKRENSIVSSDQFLLAALDTAMTWREKYASDETVYAEVQPFLMNHILRFPGLGRTVAKKGGNSNTLDVNGYGEHGASMRSLIHLGQDNTEIFTVLAGGQSGRVTSSNYANQVDNWKNGNYNEVNFYPNTQSLKPQISFKK